MTHTTSPPPLRSGFTTGSCAAAAARGAVIMLTLQHPVSHATITLPGGKQATFELHGQTISPGSASCHVIKDAGDDPDITNGAELHVTATNLPPSGQPMVLRGGIGIGIATKPGLAIAPGEAAINPVPRAMIAEAVQEFLTPEHTLQIVVSIPDGEERATKTLNARLGIMGGLSILGTTGIVRPISAKAWTDTIDTALDVAKACGCPTVVLSTGRTSEVAAQAYLPQLPEEAYVMMGDHVAHALIACQQRGFNQPFITCQFAKLLKIACGHANTHATASELDLHQLAEWVADSSLPPQLVEKICHANTAREVIVDTMFNPQLIELVSRAAVSATCHHAPNLSPRFLLTDYNKTIVFAS